MQNLSTSEFFVDAFECSVSSLDFAPLDLDFQSGAGQRKQRSTENLEVENFCL
jgi:hypothetical protein